MEDVTRHLTTVAAVLQVSNRKWEKLGFNLNEVALIRNAALPLPEQRTVAECINDPNKWKRIRIGCKALDNILGNGISNVEITEIAGEAVSVQLPEHLGGLGKSAVYICTDNLLPTSRLCEISDYFKNHYRQNINFTDNIFVERLIIFSNVYEIDYPVHLNRIEWEL